MQSKLSFNEKLLGKAREKYARDFLFQVATFNRPQVTQGKDGSHGTEHKPTRLRVPCKVMAQDSESIIDEAEQLTAVASSEIRFPYGTVLKDTDEYEIDGQRYTPAGPADTGRANAFYVSIVCTKI